MTARTGFRKERTSASGIALIVAIIILATLTAIAVPFVASMISKEKVTKNNLYQTHTRLGALSAREHAVSLLMRGHSFYEHKPQALPPFNTPDYDTPDEFKIDFDAYKFSSVNEASNPKGQILGCEIQDEQGKINIRTAPPTLINNIRAMTQNGLRNTADFITEYSYRSSGWIAPVQLCGYKTVILSSDGRRVHCLSITHPVPLSYFADRTRIRLSCGDREFRAYMSESPVRECVETNIW